ncbi:E3 ubiquitin/ISG15 ligase TRIM25-like isoform X2 [Gouania willdenowi]|uniref:E3 ubiquitin/ISG15 ligase TRIM25-like isoform X2 n=1 Tax=Gouania willdenowi TaxID=441366 RepID=UPI001056A3FB|nr:E3 ubiquitin/ISG15 ligase TRIM25-like isoform X2 [Gouania willdenowi]
MMDEAEKTRLEEMLMCPVCHDIFKDPRQLPCGHSMCLDCLENLMDHSFDAPFRCPDCRAHFGQVIGIQRSYTLTNIVEDFRINRQIKEQQTKCVYCDYCRDTQTTAVKTCLKCEVSLCHEHVRDHQELPVFTGHPLIEPLSDLMERKCPQHEDQVLKFYCSSSRRYICNICALESKQQNAATEVSGVLRRQLTEFLDQKFNTLTEQMAESRDFLKRVHINIQHQMMNPAALTHNGVTVVLLFLWFIVLYYAYSFSVENQMLTEELKKQQNGDYILSGMAALLWLDMNTVSPFLRVSADLQTVESVLTKIDYPISEGRFNETPQVLSYHCFSSGTHIWEVEAEGHWDVAVSYQSIQRKSRVSSRFGHNAKSWSLSHDGKGGLFVYHDNIQTSVAVVLKSSRIAVVVNFDKGSILFSAVDYTSTILHQFNTELTGPVCLGLGLHAVVPTSRASVVKAA